MRAEVKACARWLATSVPTASMPLRSDRWILTSWSFTAMTEDDSQQDQKLVVVATAGNEAEADVIRQRLEAAAIAAITQRAIGGPEWGASGSRYVYVRAADEARARDILAVQYPSPEDPDG